MELNLELERLLKYSRIQDELERAEKKHPIFPLNIFEQLAIMQEEAGEVAMVEINKTMKISGKPPAENVVFKWQDQTKSTKSQFHATFTEIRA